MAEYISFQPSDFFSTLLYSYAASPNAITGAGFAPDAVSLKGISGTSGGNNWYIGNTVMGNTKTLRWNDNSGETTTTDSILSFDSDGYTLGADATANCNSTGTNYVGYNWKAGTTSGLSGGTITPSAYSINTTSRVSVIAYTGNGTAGATIPHGLGVAPDMVIVKKLSTTSDWWVYHSKMDTTAPQDYHMVVNSNATRVNNNGEWYDTAPTSTLVTLGANTTADTVTYIAYCFAGKTGFSNFQEYWGNGQSSDGTFVYTGFRPAFVLIKKSQNATADWMVFDDKRLGYNPDNNNLNPNLSGAQGTTDYLDFISNGFKLRTSDALVNGSGDTYIYMAFAEFPIVSSNDVPTVAR